MLKNTKGIIKNRQSRNTGNIGHTIHMPKTNKTHTHIQKQQNTHIHKNNKTHTYTKTTKHTHIQKQQNTTQHNTED
jgi:hypothetical protein